MSGAVPLLPLRDLMAWMGTSLPRTSEEVSVVVLERSEPLVYWGVLSIPVLEQQLWAPSSTCSVYRHVPHWCDWYDEHTGAVPGWALRVYGLLSLQRASTLLRGVWSGWTLSSISCCHRLFKGESWTFDGRVLCCVVLCCVLLYCVALHCVVFYCVVLYCAALYCVVFYCVCCIVFLRLNKVVFCLTCAVGVPPGPKYDASTMQLELIKREWERERERDWLTDWLTDRPTDRPTDLPNFVELSLQSPRILCSPQ